MDFNGLTKDQVIQSREKNGSNKLPDPRHKKWYEFAVDALKEKINLVLIALACIFLVLVGFGVQEISDPVMIILVLLLVTSLSVNTGLKVAKMTNALRSKSSVRYCSVIRDGAVQTINKDELVVGDLVIVESGQEIYADGYIVHGDISVSNAAINGETKECRKIPIDGYEYIKDESTDAYTNQNHLFAGTTVMSGEGKMTVTAVGVNTVNGDTLVKMQTLEAPKTALDIALDNLAAFISKWGFIAATISFVVMMASGIVSSGGMDAYFGNGAAETVQKIATNLSVALTIVVAAVPEGLPLIIKLVTLQNVKTMERFNILTKSPNKIPEMAYVDLICTDKTGTLTTGVMTPKVFMTGDSVDHGIQVNTFTKEALTLNNSAQYNSDGEISGGNSIDRAVLSMVSQKEYDNIIQRAKVVKKLPFDSKNKFSAVEIQLSEGSVSYYKGAPERIIEKCTSYFDDSGEAKDLTPETLKNLNESIRKLNNQAIRCIALAYKEESLGDGLAADMVLMGIIGVVDPVRAEVPDAVRVAHEAGIQVIEITGDCIETAIAVAKECGIYNGGSDVALTDAEFVAMTDEEVKAIIPDLRVIARCSPNTKLRLVTLAQEMGRSVGMTGDGTNDSPALKKADVGFAMNNGTDVAKEAGDIILTDNNFASVVKGVELGRTFMHNILMFLEFQLPINVSLLILNILYPIFWVGSLLTSVHILIVNIIMDSLNSLSFGGEPPKKEYMSEKPIKKGSGLFIRGAKSRIGISAIWFIIVYFILLATPVKNYFNSEASLAARFALLCLLAVFNGFTIRTDSLNISNGLKNNKLFVGIAAGIIVGAFALVQFSGNILHLVPLTGLEWGIVIVLALAIIPVNTIAKFLRRE